VTCWSAPSTSSVAPIVDPGPGQALDALRQQVPAGTHCRADTALGFMK
jgi:hypothetical protein